ncbi:MAG: glycosyltransferase family 2 protein [Pseudomonadota bacterium]
MPDHTNSVAILPARDEALSVFNVVTSLLGLIDDNGSEIFSRVIVCDNGSSDKTSQLALEAGATVVHEPIAGYGAACLKGLAAIDNADTVVFVDADGSVDTNDIVPMLAEIENGADLVIGNRVPDLRETDSMTPAQIMGTRLICSIINVIWRQNFHDTGPLRAIRYSSLGQLDMQDRRFGWTVEMQVKAVLNGLVIREIPVRCLCRKGRSKISGTTMGVVRAGWGMLSTIVKLSARPKDKPKTARNVN